MSRTVSRRIAAAVAAAAVVAGGTAFGVGTGAGVAAAASCGTQVTKVQYGPVGLVGIRLVKEVVGDADVSPGGTVSYKTTISTAEGVPPLLRATADYYPAGFTFKSAKVNGVKVTPVVDTNNRSAKVQSDAGWLINGGNTVTYETTYAIPDNAAVGTVYDIGASMTPDIWGEQAWNPIGVCVTVRSPNAGESLLGSADANGFGSSSPTDILTDVISNVLGTGSSG